MTTDLLVDGKISAGNPCPFLSNCKFRFSGCPTKMQPKIVDFSCAAARLHNTIVEKDQWDGFAALAVQILRNEPERQIPDERPTDPDIVIVDDDGYTD